jgi:hypothetical protein
MKSRIVIPILAFLGFIAFCVAQSVWGLIFWMAAALMASNRLQSALCAFPGNCSGRIINVSASNGCTLTRADIRAMTPQDFEDQGFKEIGMDRVYAQAQEARMAGYTESTLQVLLMSKITNIKGEITKTNIKGSDSVILPYISRRQKRTINSNYWKITAGAPTPNAGANGVHPGSFDLTVTNNPSSLASTLQDLHQYFLSGKALFVEYASSGNVAYSLQYVISSAATVGGTTKVTVVPNYSVTGWLALTDAQRLPYQIGGANGGNAQAGTIAYLGVNSVSDFESWGQQDNAENTNSLLNYFLQTSRIVHEYTDEYLRALNSALTSNYFKLFRQLPLAEQKRIQQAKYDRDMVNSAFFGQRINENQTVEGYRKLPTVRDPANPDCVLEYKSNALGFRTQLSDCSRVLDHQGNALNLDTLFATLYLVKRAREATGEQVEVIDAMCDRFTAGRIQDLMISYYKKKYGVVTNRQYQPDQALVFENQVQLKYNAYQLPPELGGFTFAVFTHQFFDDKLAASSGSNRGRALWILDWSDIELGVAGTNSATRRTNEADQLYNYVIKANIKHVTLNSMQWCPIIEDPNRHYIVENFSDACPSLTVAGCSVDGPL